MSARRMGQLVRAAVLGAAALSLVALPAQAQFGGLKERLKQKVAEKTAEKAVEKSGLGPKGGADSARATPAAVPAAAQGAAPSRAARHGVPAASAAGPEEPAVLPLTGPVLDRFAAALEAERVERAAAAQRKAAVQQKSTEYSQCMLGVMQGPEYQKVGEKMQAAADKNDMKAYSAALDEQLGLIKTKCGEQPTEEDPSREIRAKALEAGRFTERQYSILEERVLPFCRIKGRTGYEVKMDSRLVYTDEERAALEPRCAALTKAYDAIR
ncbi:MAG TPA: hypothetical protein VFS08_12290 [Gemmatimonadaceae bacterium]|nr:hypothetical protein [Gemmatimonadaceae bacterium]